MQTICTSLQADNHANTSSLNFTGRMIFLTPNQQCQSTEGIGGNFNNWKPTRCHFLEKYSTCHIQQLKAAYLPEGLLDRLWVVSFISKTCRDIPLEKYNMKRQWNINRKSYKSINATVKWPWRPKVTWDIIKASEYKSYLANYSKWRRFFRKRLLPLKTLSNKSPYVSMRCYFDVRSKADISQLNLSHGTKNYSGKRRITTTIHSLTALFPTLPRWTGTRMVKPIWVLLKQETVSGNGISWAIWSLHHTPDSTPTLRFFRPGALP